MKEGVNRQILLVEKPSGKLELSISPGRRRDAQAERRRSPRARALHIAGRCQPCLDVIKPGSRAAVEPNAVMAGGSIAEVIESKAPGFAPR